MANFPSRQYLVRLAGSNYSYTARLANSLAITLKFKDFLRAYNTITETCFIRCVNTFRDREITSEEDLCTETCAHKHIRINHKILSTFMEVQPKILEKRMEEVNKVQEEMDAAQKQQELSVAASVENTNEPSVTKS